jgi:hypothetical protein
MEQLKELGIATVTYAKAPPPPGRRVRIKTPSGQGYLVTGVSFTRRAGRFILGRGEESVVLRWRYRVLQQAYVAGTATALIATLTALIQVLQPRPSSDGFGPPAARFPG